MSVGKSLQIVSFGQAQRLKAAGFDWESYGDVYSDVGELVSVQFADVYETPAPTVALALKWARDAKNTSYTITRNYYGEWSYWLTRGGHRHNCGTHDETESALLDAVLDEIEKEE